MYINAVLSFLNAWEKLQREHPEILSEIQKVLASIDLARYKRAESLSQKYNYIALRELTQALSTEFVSLNWSAQEMVRTGNARHIIDCKKDCVGLEISFLPAKTIQSDMFAKYPLIIKAQKIQLLILLVAMESLHGRVADRTAFFEHLRDRLVELQPIPLKYPFAIVGVSDIVSPPNIEELTSEMDSFLIETVGLSLAEMKLSGEQERYDFKESLPETRPIFHLACAMTNQPGGGVILIGVDNAGDIKGIFRGEIDKLKQRITNTIRSNCQPCPSFSLLDFADPSTPNKCVLVIHIQELESKPCMADEKVYVRVGSESRPASSEEIRRLLLR